jgi:hypothetical protein
MTNWDRRMETAPKNGTQILVLVATGDPEFPLEPELVWWEPSLTRFDGDFRYDPTPGNYSKAEPVAWATLPPIPEDLIALVTKKRAPRPKRPSKAAAGKPADKAKAPPPEPAASPKVVPLRPKTPQDAALAMMSKKPA